MRQAANYNHTPDCKLEDTISGLFEKYYSQFSRLVGPSRENDRVEIDFKQRLSILQRGTTSAPLFHLPIDNINTYERACILDNIEVVLGDGQLGNQVLQEIMEARKEICKQLGCDTTTSWDALARGYLGNHQTETISPAEILEGNGVLFTSKITQDVLDIVSRKENGTLEVNDNLREITLEEKRARGLPYLLALFGLIQKFTQIQSQSREEFVQQLQILDTQGKIELVVYSLKYELSLLLEIPEMSTWEAILAKMEEKFPHASWSKKAA